MGPIEAPCTDQPFELGLVFEVIADDPETSAAVLALTRSAALHVTYPGRKGIAGNLAFPFSPSDISAGPVYKFTIHHLVKTEDPCSPFAMGLFTP
jgi:hypothetical protein